jgi:disulfide bond formation protein DsbB
MNPAKLALGNYVYQLLILLAFAGVLTAALVLQYAYGELPCPLCLLQRVAMFGICFGIMLDFRRGFSYQNVGFSLLFAVFLLIVSVRQVLLDIYPRPGHSYIGSAVLGLHMPVWSVVIAVLVLAAYAVRMCVIGRDTQLLQIAATSPLKRVGEGVSLYVLGLCAVNFVSVFVQCGAGECHTTGYALF